MGQQPRILIGPGTMYGVGGREREGKPPKLWSNFGHGFKTPATGAVDSNAPLWRIGVLLYPPSFMASRIFSKNFREFTIQKQDRKDLANSARFLRPRFLWKNDFAQGIFTKNCLSEQTVLSCCWGPGGCAVGPGHRRPHGHGCVNVPATNYSQIVYKTF